MSYKIYDFVEIGLSKKYLKSLPKYHLAFIVDSSLAGNDMSVFAKLVIGSGRTDSDERIISEISALNHWSLRRVFSAKIIEFIKLIDDYSKKLERSKAAEENEFGKYIKKEITNIKLTDEYKFAKDLRNSATNHYNHHNTIESIDKYADDHKFTMLYSSQAGNSYFPLGEEIAHLNHFDSDPSIGLDIMKNQHWLHETGGKLIRLHHKIINRIFTVYPIDMPRKKTFFISNRQLLTEDDVIPILFYNGERSRI